MKIYKRAFDPYPPAVQAALRAAAVEHENYYELPAAEFLRITARPSSILHPPSSSGPPPDLDAALTGEIVRSGHAAPCRGCGG